MSWPGDRRSRLQRRVEGFPWWSLTKSIGLLPLSSSHTIDYRMKVEQEYPLSSCEVGLVDFGRPQSLLIDMDGKEERSPNSPSIYNQRELDLVVRLLDRFPEDKTNDIMII
ncbi:hypothetical protein PENTCL1PPCAC_3535, partial [Pristionchus entomophagus]